MTDTRRDEVSCHVCEAESEHTVALRATEETPPDTDTRPGETLRSTMPFWVQRCPSCGYCAPDLEEGPARAARVVKTAGYKSLLEDTRRPALANSFLAASVVLEAGGGSLADAAWQAVYAAWACDDAHAEDAAVECRARAIELIDRAQSAGLSMTEEPGGGEALVADLLRRCGRFDECIARVQSVLATGEASAAGEAGGERAGARGPIARVLRYVATLASKGDRAAHSSAEAPPESAAS